MRINVANRTSTGTKLSRVSVKSPGLMSANKGKPLCTYFERTGQCRYGDRCRYQHATSHNSAAAFSERSWSRSQASPSPKPDGSQSIRIMSYNILADLLAHEHADELYRACPKWCIRWEQRGPGIMAEILHWAPDIGCLQEVDHPDEFDAFLQQHGYETTFASRTGDRTDGCLTFWRKQRFTAKATEIVFMRDHGLRDNVALLVLLEQHADPQQDWQWGTGKAQHSRDGPPALLIGNTHLLFNPKRGDIKTAQVRTMLDAMRAMQRDAGQPSWALLMGDFNSIPGSAIYRFVKTSELDCSLEDRRNMSGQLSMNVGRWVGNAPRYERSRSFPERRLAQPSVEKGTPCNGGTPPAWQASPASFAGQLSPMTPQEMSHSSSVPFGLARTSASVAQTAVRAQSLSATAPQLYSHVGSSGEAFWSPVPPNNTCEGTPHPIYYEPMCVEEASPEPDPRMSRSASRAARMVNMATWSKAELAVAMGTSQDGSLAHELGLLRTQSRAQHMLRHIESNVDAELDKWTVRHTGGSLHSAYAEVLGEEPEYSSCHGRVIATLDYMWYSEAPFQPALPVWAAQRPPAGSSPGTGSSPGGTQLHSRTASRLADLQNGDSAGQREVQQSLYMQKVREQAISPELPDISEDAELLAASGPGAAANPGDAELAAAGVQSKLGAAVKDWKAKQREKPDVAMAKQPKEAIATAPGSAPDEAPRWVLRPKRVVQPPPLSSLRCGLPSPKYPSDHISLIADFTMIQQ